MATRRNQSLPSHVIAATSYVLNGKTDNASRIGTIRAGRWPTIVKFSEHPDGIAHAHREGGVTKRHLHMLERRDLLRFNTSLPVLDGEMSSIAPASQGRYPFKVGKPYTRQDIFRVLGIADPRGGDWYTGYASHGTDWFVFCGIGTPGRTGHDYHNHFRGDELVWYAKNRSRLGHSSIQRLIDPLGHVYIFYREHDRDPFTFAGIGRAQEVKDSSPVELVWNFHGVGIEEHPEFNPNEIGQPNTVFEGARKSVFVNIYERDPSARRKCIAHWGTACLVCGLDFASRYGSIGEGFIHVHHLRPLAEIGSEYELDPVIDLRPVCPNCHAMLHRREPTLGLEELHALMLDQLAVRPADRVVGTQ